MTGRCPECEGPVMDGHHGGWLAICHCVNCLVYRAEDATRAADNEMWALGQRTRPATPTERQLLAHLEHPPPEPTGKLAADGLPEKLITVLVGAGASYSRRWPQLEPDEEPDEEPAGRA